MSGDVTGRLRAALERHLVAAADKAALRMEAKAVALAPKGASAPGLRNEIHGQAVQTSDTIKASLVCTSPYGKYLEFGTGPAAGHARYMPPPGVLRQWIERKLGLSGEAAAAAEGAIRWKIYLKGTEPQPFMKPAFDIGRARWKQDVMLAAKAAIKEACLAR